MPHSFGYRAQTRTLFKKAYKTNGRCHTKTMLTTFKRGDYVDIKVDPSIHKGMPFKHYHGRTGVIFNVNKRAVGIIVNKEVNGRVLAKRIHVAIPHVRHSKCRDSIIRRVKENEDAKKAARAGGEKVNLKRENANPKDGYVWAGVLPSTIQAIPYVDLV